MHTACGSQALSFVFPKRGLQNHARLGRHRDASCISSCRCVCNSYGSGCLPLPGLITGSSNTPRVQRHFMLTERFSARNPRLNKLESSLRRKQKMEGEELTLRCTACVSVYLGNHPGEVHLRPTPGQHLSLLGPDLRLLDFNGPRLPTCSQSESHPRGFPAFFVLMSLG